jgi:hypothetical protein
MTPTGITPLAVVITRAFSPETDGGQNRIGGIPACPLSDLTATYHGDERFRQGGLVEDSKPRRSTSLIRSNPNINGEQKLALAA